MNCPTGPACPPGGVTLGATPAPMYPVHPGMVGPAAAPFAGPMGPMGPMPYPVPPIGPSGVLNMDIGPGLLNMDMGPGGYCEMGAMHEAIPQRIHVVLRCETVWSIARLYNVDINAIIQANNLTNPNLITVGQRLIIPGGLTFDIP